MVIVVIIVIPVLITGTCTPGSEHNSTELANEPGKFYRYMYIHMLNDTLNIGHDQRGDTEPIQALITNDIDMREPGKLYLVIKHTNYSDI